MARRDGGSGDDPMLAEICAWACEHDAAHILKGQ
jgi:hypothetical protein